uniref:Protein Vpu n=1 Tax=Human immunodeficiency virus type 1 TaxID=11676 RepID=A0A6H0JSX1_HV1|nr:vpu protein [Human immunodeficiency virus 1]
MQPLYIWSIVALVVAEILAIVVWSIVFIEYRKILKERKIDRLLAKISERAEDSGNESNEDQEKLSELVKRGHLAPWDVNNL